MNFKKLAATLITMSALAGCESPVMIAADQNKGQMAGMFEIAFPAMMLVQQADGVEEILEGNLIGHVSGNARYNVNGPVFGQCTGVYTKNTGLSTITCEGGFSYSENVGRQRPKMSGTNIATGTYDGVAYVGAFGWGNNANEASVRQAIEEYKSNLR